MPRFKLLVLSTALPLLLAFTPQIENHIPTIDLEPPVMTPTEEALFLEELVKELEAVYLEKLIEKQELLQSLGWYSGEVDGIWGPLTDEATENFIKAANLHDDAPLREVLAKLRSDSAPRASTPARFTSTNGIPHHWLELARCESGNWINGGRSFEGPIRWWWAKPGSEMPSWGTTIHHGGLQFHPNTWSAYKLSGYPQYAYDATPQQQYEVAKRVQAAQGWRAWPTCARMIGLY